MLARIKTATVIGVSAFPIDVEVDLSRGLFVFSVVGLPANAVSESRTRVKSALANCGYGFPKGRVTVNLAPANIRKDGTGFDLPIALGIVAAQGLIKAEQLGATLVLGELSLDGQLRPVRGLLPIAAGARRLGLSTLIIPKANASEAAVSTDLDVFVAEHLTQVIESLAGGEPLKRAAQGTIKRRSASQAVDMRDIKGQLVARRATEVAAAGGHNLMLSGPPGTGKTMLARRLPTIVPELSAREMVETSSIASVAGVLPPDQPLIWERPFRAPHHSVSDVALIGGGAQARPGEVSLAHNGVLFLDELPEFKRAALESLRQPLEDRAVVVARAQLTVLYPARFMLVASMNPCPCGYLGHPRRECECHPSALRGYRSRVSGPLLDRFDLQITVEPVSPLDLRTLDSGEPSDCIRTRVLAARERQQARFGTDGKTNADMNPGDVRAHCELGFQAAALMERAVERLHLSARAHDRILKVARTIADLDAAASIHTPHLSEAIQYRMMTPGSPK